MGLFDLFKSKKQAMPAEAQDMAGDGATKESAVVINATSSIVGIDAEYQWLTSCFGKQDRDWKVEIRMQSDDNGRSYETFVIELSDGSSKTIYFDISSFYGRF
jgi:hypothetical protein